MKKILLTFLFCMIGFSSFALDLTCEFKENKYLKLLDNDNRVTLKSKSDDDFNDFRIAILEDKCVVYKKYGEDELNLTTTDSKYTCRNQYNGDGDDIIRTAIRIDRYSGRAENEIFISRRFESVNIYQCKKSVKKF